MQQRSNQNPGAFQRNYTAKEISQYEYCPLVWWHEQYDPAALADTDKLFAQLVALEHEYGSQAPDIPDYQVIEQILVRRGAFEGDLRESQNPSEENEYPNYTDEEYAETVEQMPKVRRLLRLALFTLGSGILLVLLSVFTTFIK
jgi:hypothetical protein